MFGNSFKVIELNERIKELESELKAAKKVISKINTEILETEFAIDWKKMNAFSIERMVHDNSPCTVIGYFIKEPVLSGDGNVITQKDVLHQWYLHCSDKRHRELVVQFRESRE